MSIICVTGVSSVASLLRLIVGIPSGDALAFYARASDSS